MNDRNTPRERAARKAFEIFGSSGCAPEESAANRSHESNFGIGGLILSPAVSKRSASLAAYGSDYLDAIALIGMHQKGQDVRAFIASSPKRARIRRAIWRGILAGKIAGIMMRRGKQ